MKWFFIVLLVVILFAVTGCSNKNERVVLSQPTTIEVHQPVPRLMEKPLPKKALPLGVDNGEALQVIRDNNISCLLDTDKLVQLQGYTGTLLNYLKTKPNTVLVK